MTSIGIIGAGMIANVHAEAALAVGTSIVAVYDSKEKRTKSFHEKFGCDIESTVGALLARPDIDGIVIAVPNDQHASLAIQALNAGHHVLLEKPMAMSLSQCDDIIAARDESGKVLQMGFVCRYSPAAMKAKELIDRGAIGNVQHVEATLLRQRGIPGLGGWFTTKAKSGGGCLIDIGVHLIDLSMHLTSTQSPSRVSGSCHQAFTVCSYAYEEMWSTPETNGTFDVEDRIRATVHDKSGVSFHYNVSWATHLPENTMKDGLVIEGTDGALVVDLWSDEMTRGFAVDGLPQQENITFEVTEPWDDAFQAEHKAFASAISNGTLDDGAGSGEDGRVVQSVVEAIYASDVQGKEIAVVN
jgi:predicted dehydrogenase